MFSLPKNAFFSFAKVSEVDASSVHILTSRESSLLSSKACVSRQIEFKLGRQAAKEALKKLYKEKSLGIPDPLEILSNERRIPIWPKDIVGSISHCGDTAIALVGLKSEFTAIGIDIISRNRELNKNILKTLCSEDEIRSLTSNQILEFKDLSLSIFSVKESIYKLLSSLGLTGLKWFYFKIIEISETCLNDGSKYLEFKVNFDEAVIQKLKEGGHNFEKINNINLLLEATHITSYFVITKK